MNVHIIACYLNRSALETDLKIEREWRAALQKNLDQEKEQVTQLHTELQQFRDVKRVGHH